MQPDRSSQLKADGSGPRRAPCQFLEWDSQFFQRRIGTVQTRQLSESALDEIEQWCKAESIDCLYFLADFENPETIRLAENNSFRLVDMRVTLVSNLALAPKAAHSTAAIRMSQQSDIPALKEVARSSHGASRFYFDQNFPRNHCDALYETWIERSCSGFADAVLVPEVNGMPAGYLSCRLMPDGTGNIGLVGLAAEVRGRDIGADLLLAAHSWFMQKGVEQVTVVTQGRNVAAQRLYQRCGYCTQSLHVWYHRWF